VEQLGNYHIELACAENAGIFEQMTISGGFKRALEQWVGSETGCLPDVQCIDHILSRPAVSVCCTESFMRKIETRFADDIAKVTRIKSIGELPPEQQEPWNRLQP
jgi:hypothetical protein